MVRSNLKSDSAPDLVAARDRATLEGAPAPATLNTRFADCSRGQALAILLLTLGALAWCLYVVFTRETIPSPRPSPQSKKASSSTAIPGDSEFYRTIVRRVHAGENYYDAVASELQRRGYPPHSVFNWRTPFYAWLFGKLPSPRWGQVLLGIGVLATLAVAYRAVKHAGGDLKAAAAVLLLLGPFAWGGFLGISMFAELWSGMLIALSVCGYALGYWRLGVGSGLLALFFRELSLPYCIVSLGLALWQRRRRETACWLAGLALYAVFMVVHGMEAARRITTTDLVHATNWIQFSGTAFVLLTTQINYYFLVLAPTWVAAVYLPLALLGLAGWRGAAGLHASLTAFIYVVAFHVIGVKPHNGYWGLMYAPLLCLGIVWAPKALRDLRNAVLRPRVQFEN